MLVERFALDEKIMYVDYNISSFLFIENLIHHSLVGRLAFFNPKGITL